MAPVGEQRFLERVHLDRRGQLLDAQPDRLEVRAKAPRDLCRQRAGRRDVDHPTLVGLELVQRLKDSELREQRLTARCRHVDHDRRLRLVEQPLFEQRRALRRQKLEHRLMFAVRERMHEIRGSRIHCPRRPPQRVRHHDARRRMQPAQHHLVLCVPRRGGRLDPRLEMLVQRAERIARLALQHVPRKGLGRLRPVVQRRQPKGHRPVHRRGPVVQTTLFVRSLIVAQAGDDLADAIEIIPPVLAKQPHPAIEQPVEQPAVPLRLCDTRRPQRLSLFPIPAPEIRPAIAAIGDRGELKHEEQSIQGLAGHGMEPADVERTERSRHRLVPQLPILAPRTAQLIEPLDRGQLEGERHALQKRSVLRLLLEREADLAPNRPPCQALVNEIISSLQLLGPDGGDGPMFPQRLQRPAGQAHDCAPARRETISSPMPSSRSCGR